MRRVIGQGRGFHDWQVGTEPASTSNTANISVSSTANIPQQDSQILAGRFARFAAGQNSGSVGKSFPLRVTANKGSGHVNARRPSFTVLCDFAWCGDGASRTPELLASAIPSPPQSRFDTADFTERVRVNHQTLSGPLVFTLPASNFVAILRPDWFNGTDQTAVPAKTCGWGWGLVLEESGPKGIESGKGYATNQELSKSSCATPHYRPGTGAMNRQPRAINPSDNSKPPSQNDPNSWRSQPAGACTSTGRSDVDASRACLRFIYYLPLSHLR